jgi:hypothetical protein
MVNADSLGSGSSFLTLERRETPSVRFLGCLGGPGAVA